MFSQAYTPAPVKPIEAKPTTPNYQAAKPSPQLAKSTYVPDSNTTPKAITSTQSTYPMNPKWYHIFYDEDEDREDEPVQYSPKPKPFVLMERRRSDRTKVKPRRMSPEVEEPVPKKPRFN